VNAMNWSQLLLKDRYTSDHVRAAPVDHPTSAVTVYVEDIERVLYSSPFRRLQGKTQVHPLPSFDSLRNRLTHTIEVAHVGRIIATHSAKVCCANGDRDFDQQIAGDAVYAACLAHDVGNPPFGHIGEYAIQTWFERRGSSVISEMLRNDEIKNDFLHFDGNAQGFRILTRLSGWRMAGGLQLSCSTLGAFSKYPYGSKQSTKKKFGFMHDDRSAAQKIFTSLGLLTRGDKFCRHPLAFIVEAADDICYLTTDIEDSFRIGLLPFPSAQNLLRDIAEMGGHMPRYEELSTADFQDRIAYLRAGAVSSLIDAAINEFCNNSTQLLEGRYSQPLLNTSKYKPLVEKIRETCENLYTAKIENFK
jgi:dGTPase